MNNARRSIAMVCSAGLESRSGFGHRCRDASLQRRIAVDARRSDQTADLDSQLVNLRVSRRELHQTRAEPERAREIGRARSRRLRVDEIQRRGRPGRASNSGKRAK